MKNYYIKEGFLRILMSSKGSYIKTLRKRVRTNVSSIDILSVKCANDNCTEEDIYLHFLFLKSLL